MPSRAIESRRGRAPGAGEPARQEANAGEIAIANAPRPGAPQPRRRLSRVRHVDYRPDFQHPVDATLQDTLRASYFLARGMYTARQTTPLASVQAVRFVLAVWPLGVRKHG